MFVRNRKLTLTDLIIQIMTRTGLTAVMELIHYFKSKKMEEVSTQAYFKAKQNLNPEVFVRMNDYYMKLFYKSESEVKLWNGYLILAVDGSIAEIPNSNKNREKYGTQGNSKCKGPARALINGLFDVLNNFYLDLQIANVKTGEKKLAEENLKAIERIGIKQKVLVIFDRGYPSLELLNYLDEHKIDYIIRIRSNLYKKEREDAGLKDCRIKIAHTKARLDVIKKSNEELYEKIKDKESIETRCISSKTPSDNDFAVLTSLPEEIAADKIIEAYFMRWKIEEAYNTLKNKMKFENVSGKACIYVKQDFYAQIYVYNMMEDFRHSTEEEILEKTKNYKYTYRINQNITIGIFKGELVYLLLENDDKVSSEMYLKIQMHIKKYVLPIRKSKSHKRKGNMTNKYACNQKPSF